MKRPRPHGLGDFTADWRVIPISLLAIGIGFVGTLVAWALLAPDWAVYEFVLFSPVGHHAGVARGKSFGRVGHPGAGGGIAHHRADGALRVGAHPGARNSGSIESILIHGSRIPPRLAILKPISSAISIGSGGPSAPRGPSL